MRVILHIRYGYIRSKSSCLDYKKYLVMYVLRTCGHKNLFLQYIFRRFESYFLLGRHLYLFPGFGVMALYGAGRF